MYYIIILYNKIAINIIIVLLIFIIYSVQRTFDIGKVAFTYVGINFCCFTALVSQNFLYIS